MIAALYVALRRAEREGLRLKNSQPAPSGSSCLARRSRRLSPVTARAEHATSSRRQEVPMSTTEPISDTRRVLPTFTDFDEAPPWLSYGQASGLTGGAISPRTLRRWASQGRVRTSRPSRRRVLVCRDSFRELLERAAS